MDPGHDTQQGADARSGKRDLVLATALLALVSLGLYAFTGQHEFLSLDDTDYVVLNPMVNQGLGWSSVGAAFSQAHSSNWHPLTWLSHMLDCQLFGLDAGKHHLMSAGYHALNAALCLLVFARLGVRLGPSLVIAGLFALHPQRAESVAWISERKDLLSGSFFFLTILAQLHFARQPSPGRRLLVLLCFAAGLLAKPSLIMLPVLLVLLDRFPLSAASARPSPERLLGFQLREKAPLFLLALVSALVTYLVQRDSGAVSQEASLHLMARASNALSSYGEYLKSFLLPLDLAYFYPHPALVQADWTPWNAGAGLGLLLLIGGACLLWAKRQAWHAASLGLNWFIVFLIPMIGLVQVGEQARADRYSYLASIGLGILLVLGLPWQRLPARLNQVLAALALSAACAGSFFELRHWTSSQTLYERAAQVTQHNYAAALGLANLDNHAGRLEQAAENYELVLQLRPRHPQALYSFGLLRQKQGRASEALALYRRALAVQPDSSVTWLNLGALHAGAGRLPEAIQAFGKVVSLEPKGSPPRRQAALNLSQMGRDFQGSLKQQPQNRELRELLRAVEAALHPDG